MRKMMWKRWMAMSMAALVAAGTLSVAVPLNASAAQNTTVVSGTEKGDEAAEEAYYVLMNIPYAEFYQSELNNNTVPVDVFTSATKNKTRTASLAAGSYHVDSNGTDITGITYPVKVNPGVDLSKYTQLTDDSSVQITVTNRGQTNTTTFTGKDALFEGTSYSYYKLEETPSYYKELTQNSDGTFSFSKAKGEVTKVTDATANFMTESQYGDYELDFTKLDAIAEDDTVYGVVIGTKEGTDYGLRHIENIWRRTELAWCTGFTAAVHSCPTSSAHYESMMGQHINKVTYYTNKGIFEVAVNDIYVPVKFDSSKISAASADLSDGKTSVTTTGLPADYDAEYSVSGLKGVKVENGVLHFDKTSAAPGTYTLNIQDKSGKYAEINTTFVLSTNKNTVVFDTDKDILTAADGFTQADLENYIANITSVSVDGKAYAASGRGSVQLVKEDGSLDTTKDAIKEQGSYEMTISATGYPDLSFTFKNKERQEVTTSKDSYQLTYGAKAFQLGAKAATALSYQSSNEKVATVDANGNVTIKGAGSAVITIHAAEDAAHKEAVKTVNVKVAQAAQKISGLSTSYKTTYKKSLVLKAKAVTALSYKSSNASVISVDKNGKVTAKKAGSAYITVTAAANTNYKAASARVKVTAQKASQSVKVKTASKTYKKATLKKKAQSFKIGASAQGTITYQVSGKSKKYITVSKAGKVTVKKNTPKGTYSVKVSTKGNSNYSAASKTVTIRVK